MRKLLSANFSRLWKSKVFWVLEGFCFGFGVFAYILVAINTRNLGQGWLEYEAHSYFYLPIMFIAVIVAIFACFFIGNDYSDGTLRNKLVVGHSRVNIYFSFFLTVCVAAVLFLLAHVLAMVIVGLPLSGAAVLTHVELQPWRIMNFLLTAIVYAAIFTLLSMLDSNMARNVVVSLLVACILIFAGLYFYGKVSAPEHIQLVTHQSDGSLLLQDGPPNSDYLTGMTRIVYHCITMILPSGSVMLSLDKSLGFDWRNPLCSVVMILLLTVSGISFFKRKDIK